MAKQLTDDKYAELREHIAKLTAEWAPVKPKLMLSHSVYPVYSGAKWGTITVKH